MAGNTEFFLKQSQQDALLQWCKKTLWANGTVGAGAYDGFSHRDALERIDREYYRDNIYTLDKIQATLANARGDKKKLQDIVIPIAESQTETQLAYLTSVFLTGVPIFGVTADASNIDGAKQYQAIMAENAIHGGWVRQFIIAMHDSLKYFGVMEATWCKEQTPSFDTTVSTTGQRQDVRQIVWSGNSLIRRSPYNCFWDRRVPLTQIHIDAEYAGYVTMESRITLKRYIEERGLKMNIKEAYESSLGDSIPNSNQRLFFIPDFLWNSLDNLNTFGNRMGSAVEDFSTFEVQGRGGKTRTFKNIYYKVVRYVRLIPRDYGMDVPMDNQIQIWKLTTINDQVLIEAERQSNIHGLIPLIFFQPTEDGLQFNNRSFVQKQIPMQDVASALLNGTMQAQRRAVGDRLIYDPSRIKGENIASESPTARIPVRPAGYGGKLSDMVYKIPYDDNVTPGFMQTAKEITSYANMISGQNPAQQGQFVKGNKTQSEYEDVQGHSSGRQRKCALMVEDQLMVPIKTILKANTLQYQTASTVYNYIDQQPNNTPVEIDPLKLRQAVFAYKITDGLAPEDKIISADALQGFMQLLSASPMLQAQFDLSGLVSYFMKTQNADIEQFRLQPPGVQRNIGQMQQLGQVPTPVPVPAQPGVTQP